MVSKILVILTSLLRACYTPGTVLDVGNMKIINKTKFPSQEMRQIHAHIIIIRASGNTRISLKPRYVLICLEERGTELVREKGREEQLSDLKSLQTTGPTLHRRQFRHHVFLKVSWESYTCPHKALIQEFLPGTYGCLHKRSPDKNNILHLCTFLVNFNPPNGLTPWENV